MRADVTHGVPRTKVPLRNPFPLPKNFRSDVELALHTGKMTKETNAGFLSSIASAMLVL